MRIISDSARERRFIVSNSAAGNAGSRRISPSSSKRLRHRRALRLDGERKLSRRLRRATAAAPASAAEAAQTSGNANAQRIEFFASAWRSCLRVPAIMSDGSIPAAVVCPFSDSSLP